MEALRVARVIAGLNDALTRRLLELAEAELGPPPCAYAWLALGSQGRREPLLTSDADCGLAFAEPTPVARSYFADLAERVVGGLLGAGLPPCPGGVMATTWRHPLAEWERLLASWVAAPEPQALLAAEEVLDFRPVAGALAVTPLDAVVRAVAARQGFLVQLARPAVAFRPPLGAFGRLPRRRAVDLKRGGLAPVVLLGRLFGLAAGSAARSTPARLEDAVAAGVLSRASADALLDALRVLTRLRLDAQLAALAAGEEPAALVDAAALPAPERRRLRDALREVAGVQQATRLRFRTDVAS
jgi:CBS domain-containing protein